MFLVCMCLGNHISTEKYDSVKFRGWMGGTFGDCKRGNVFDSFIVKYEDFS